MRVFYTEYLLEPQKKISGVYKSNSGCLLKLVASDGVEKFSAYHPIESLGDLPLKTFLSDQAKRDELLEKIKALSINEEEHLSGQISSYYLASSMEDLLSGSVEIKSSGFNLVKLKAANLSEINFAELEDLPFDYIFDFNGREEFVNFSKIEPQFKSFLFKRVQYIEDPYKEVKKLDFPLASDFIDYGALGDFLVVKPTGFSHDISARALEPANQSSVVVTSYLDHPLGQLLSAKWAVDHKVTNECGLWTHVLFEKNKYSELFKSDNYIDLKVGSDFIELLKNEVWKEI